MISEQALRSKKFLRWREIPVRVIVCPGCSVSTGLQTCSGNTTGSIIALPEDGMEQRTVRARLKSGREL